MRANTIYALLYASGVYGLVLWPPVRAAVTAVAEPLRRAIDPAVGQLPLPIRCILALIAFDALAYWVHRAAHASPLLWRVHRLHHSDPELGPLTTFRFHVVEIAWRMAVQFLPLYVLGIAASIPPAGYAAMLVFNVLAHSGLDWTYGLLGRAVVSPAYHAVHHRRASAANFGMFFTVWDRWFGTRAAVREGVSPRFARSPV
jgi:sterol desaturase/sphingolipid hydroxylase (fatty acid hydroxylase superfamily)